MRDTKQKEIAKQEGSRALRMLFDDFEAQIEWQNEVDQGSSNDSQEETPIQGQTVEPLTGFSSIVSPQEYAEGLNPKKEPQSTYVMIGSNQWK